MSKTHNNIWCEEYFDKVSADREGYCRLCGAWLYELTVTDAISLVDRFEDIALNRVKAESWDASDWLFDDEANALAIAKEWFQIGNAQLGDRTLLDLVGPESGKIGRRQ